MIFYIQILFLAIIQGAAELLPVSSSAHVITAEKLMGLDPSSPEMTLLLIMLHTGTMFSVIVYYWKSWKVTYFESKEVFKLNVSYIVIALICTAIVGLSLQFLIKHLFFAGASSFEIEHLFSNAPLMACALAAAGLLIIASSFIKENPHGKLSMKSAAVIGAVQGLCLPSRGFSRSGATISSGLVLGVARKKAEEFSFALAVVITPALIVKEGYRAYKDHLVKALPSGDFFMHLVMPSLLGMVFSFLAGLVALRWLSHWLAKDRWHFFGGYCLFAALMVLVIHFKGIG